MSDAVTEVPAPHAPAAIPGRVSDEVRVLAPTTHRIRISELWTTFSVARMVGVRDMKIKYKQSALGPLWLVLQPLGMLLAIAIAFSAVVNVKTGGVPYVAFALVGLCVWIYVQFSVSTAATIFPSNYQLVRRSPCPRIALVTGNLLSHLPPLGVVLTGTLIVILADWSLPLQALLLPVVTAWLIVFMLAVNMLAAAVGARFRDAVALVPLVIQGGVFVSPVGYPLTAVHGIAGDVVRANPVSGLIETWRWCLLGMHPQIDAILIAVGWTVGLILLGWFVFTRLEVRFADYV